MQMKQCVIFDFDGTIADSMWLVIAIYEEMFGAKVTEKQIQETRNLPLSKVLKQLGIPLWKVPRLLTSGRKIMRTRIEEVKPFPGMDEVFAQLKAEGYNLQIMSSNSRPLVRQFLKQHDLLQYFSDVEGGVGLFGKAPVLRKIMKHLGLTRAQVVYVGDEGRDIEGAKKARVPIISVGWGYNTPELLKSMRPDYYVDSPPQLVEVVRGLWKQ
ncbi:HAD family hydrolase [Candidatus Saccharibacteria bacterium]|nr:MAG: HAD family hydrolase [Candidatus Saccharibacteria bacterium]